MASSVPSSISLGSIVSFLILALLILLQRSSDLRSAERPSAYPPFAPLGALETSRRRRSWKLYPDQPIEISLEAFILLEGPQHDLLLLTLVLIVPASIVELLLAQIIS